MKTMKAGGPPAGLAAILAGMLLAGSACAADPATQPADKPAFKPEELEQILAPIALYPDSLLSQMLMASTYPLEVVEADRWIKANKDLKGDALTKALEAQSWDPSVKSLVNFPSVAAMMSENLDTTVKIGDAFIGQQKEVLDTIQKLRAAAQASGNLKTTAEQTVTVETQAAAQVIVIQPANPQVVYVPTYSPTVYYTTWPYPAYPPAPYYPPGYVAGRALAFTAGVAVGAAWGYAWGNCNWKGGNVDINVNQNTNINTNINRSKYQADIQTRNTSVKNGQGTFQHDANHRQGVAYRDQSTASQYGRTTSPNAASARDDYRGRTDTGAAKAATGAPKAGTGAVGGNTATNRPAAQPTQRPAASDNKSAFQGVNSGGSAARAESARGNASRTTPTRSAPARTGGGGGGRR